MSLPSESPDRRPWRPADAARALVWWFVTGLVAYGAASPGAVTTTELFGLVVPAQSLGAIGSVAWMARTRRPWREALAARISWADWVGVLIGVALQVAMGIVLVVIVEGWLGGSLPQQEVVGAADEAIALRDKVLVAVSLIVVGPIAEEVLFRGVLLRSLLASHGATGAVWISAAGFAALHLLDPNAWLVAPLLLVLGVVMGRQVVRTGRLGRSVAIHAGFNLVTVLALFTVT